MTVRWPARHVWFSRAARRRGVLTVTSAVVAVAVSAVLTAVVLGAAVGADRADRITDGRVAAAAVAVSRSLDALAAGVVGVLAVVAVTVLLGLLAAVRSDEDALLVARGATTGQRARWGAAEGALVGSVGSVVGAGAAVALCARAEALGAVLPLAGLSVAAAVLVVTTAAAVVGCRPPRPGAPSARTASLVVVSAVAVGAAAFTVWRLFVAGVPVRVAAGRVLVEPVAVVAPLAVVVAGAVVVVLAGGVAARAVAAGAGRRRGLLTAFTARRLARRWSAVAPSVLVLAAVVATGVFVAGLAGTTARVDTATARAVVGPDVRVTTPGDDIVDDRTAAPPVLDALPGATAVAPVLTDDVEVGSVTVPLVALPGRVAPSVMPGGTGRQVARLTSGGPRVGLALGSDDTRLTVAVTAGTATLGGRPRDDAVGTVAPSAWVVDDDGLAAVLPLRTDTGGTVPVGSRARVSATLPTTGGPWRLLAVEPTLSFSDRPAETEGLPVSDGLRVPVSVDVEGTSGGAGSAVVVDLGADVRIPLGTRRTGSTFPVVVTTALADRLGLEPGSRVDLVPGTVRSAVHARVAAVVSDVPGTRTTEAVAVDLPDLVALAVTGGPAIEGSDAGVPRVDETWIATEDPAATAAVARQEAPRGSTVRTAASVRSGPVVDTAVAALAGAALVGTLLAMLVLAVAVGRPDGSGPVLAELGVPPAHHARARVAEFGLPVLAAVVGGSVVGVVAVAVTAAPFAIAAVPDARGLVVAAPVVPGVAWAAPVVALVLGAAVVVAPRLGVLVRAPRPRSAVRASEPRPDPAAGRSL